MMERDFGNIPRLHHIFSGEVASIQKYGAFVKIPGCRRQGLVHVSQMSTSRVEDPGEMLAKGEKIYCKVIAVEGYGERISLSMKVVSQSSGKDLDPNNVQSSQDERKRKQWNHRGKIELGAELNTTCRRCGGHGHLAMDCYVSKGNNQYALIPDLDRLADEERRSERSHRKHKKEKKEKKQKSKRRKSPSESEESENSDSGGSSQARKQEHSKRQKVKRQHLDRSSSSNSDKPQKKRVYRETGPQDRGDAFETHAERFGRAGRKHEYDYEDNDDNSEDEGHRNRKKMATQRYDDRRQEVRSSRGDKEEARGSRHLDSSKHPKGPSGDYSQVPASYQKNRNKKQYQSDSNSSDQDVGNEDNDGDGGGSRPKQKRFQGESDSESSDSEKRRKPKAKTEERPRMSSQSHHRR